MNDLGQWQSIFRDWLVEVGSSDPAHNLQHIERVVASAVQLANAERADLHVVLPAAWLHDCVILPKDSSERSTASRLAAERAIEFLSDHQYPETYFDAISHAIVAHSFSAQVEAKTIEAKVVQDADRLDAIGAIGLCRCLLLGGHMDKELFSPEDPFCREREADDSQFIIDHFFAKLLKLSTTMQTVSGRAVAEERTNFLKQFLMTLENEISASLQ